MLRDRAKRRPVMNAWIVVATILTAAEEEAPSYNEVHVRIRTDKPLLVQEIVSSENRFNFGGSISTIEHRERVRKFCLAPCERIVSLTEASFEHRISARGVSEGQDFAFSDVGPAALVTIKTGDGRKNAGGRSLIVFGSIFTGLSAVASVFGYAVPELRNSVLVGGGVGMVVGIGGIVAGILLYINNRTHISVEPDPSYQPSRDNLSPPPLPAPQQTLTSK